MSTDLHLLAEAVKLAPIEPGSVLVIPRAFIGGDRDHEAEAAEALIEAIVEAVGHDRFVIVLADPDSPLPAQLDRAEAESLRAELDRILG